jgi:hypothetical protein
MSKLSKKANLDGWNNDTHLSVNLKTILHTDRKMKVCKDYPGVLRLDVECEEFHYDEHFTFIETLPWNKKRNPRVFNGKYISVTRQEDGSLRPNFKPMHVGKGFCVGKYVTGVANELCMALGGLIEKG